MPDLWFSKVEENMRWIIKLMISQNEKKFICKRWDSNSRGLPHQDSTWFQIRLQSWAWRLNHSATFANVITNLIYQYQLCKTVVDELTKWWFTDWETMPVGFFATFVTEKCKRLTEVLANFNIRISFIRQNLSLTPINRLLQLENRFIPRRTNPASERLPYQRPIPRASTIRLFGISTGKRCQGGRILGRQACSGTRNNSHCRRAKLHQRVSISVILWGEGSADAELCGRSQDWVLA